MDWSWKKVKKEILIKVSSVKKTLIINDLIFFMLQRYGIFANKPLLIVL
jgi:hypothetical protein